MRASTLLLSLAFPLSAQTQAPSAFQIQKARTLLRTQLACLGCHELDGEGGRTAPSLTSVSQRRSAEYIRAMVQDPQRLVPMAAMPKPVMATATADLISAYLARGARFTPALKVSTPPAHAERTSEVLYATWCANCHGSKGQGDGPNARYLPVRPAVHASAAQMGQRSDDALFDAIAGGGGVMGKSPRMPAFGATLTPPEIRSLVAYIRGLCGCTGPAWSLDRR